MASFKERVKMARISAGMSQQDLADKVGVTKQSISQYERGVRKPDMDTLTALSDIFNLSTDYLTGQSDVTLRFLTEDDLKKLAAPSCELTNADFVLVRAYHAAPTYIQQTVLTNLGLSEREINSESSKVV